MGRGVSSRFGAAVLLLGALFAGSAAPLAAGLVARLGCHCAVPMSCCERDMCTTDGDAARRGPKLSSCDTTASQDGPPVPVLILAIVPAHFALEAPSDVCGIVPSETVRLGGSPLPSDSPPPRSLLFS
jgi:hypothetical protein